MQLPSINSPSTFKDTINTLNISSASTASTHFSPIMSSRNTDEAPLTISSSQYLTHSSTQVQTFLNAQSQNEFNQKNFWQVFHGYVPEDLFKEKVLEYIKNNWGLDSSLKQNINNPILQIKKDIQYQLLIDIFFQLKFTHFINLIIIDMANFIQTENRIKESGHLDELALMIAKHDIKKEISTKLSFLFNNLYKNYFNRKNEILPQQSLIKLIPIVINELQLAEKENLETKVDPHLYAFTLPKIQSLLKENINLSDNNHDEEDEIDAIIQDDLPNSYLDPSYADIPEMHHNPYATSNSPDNLNLQAQMFTQPTSSNDLTSISDIATEEPQKNSFVRSHLEASKEISKSSEWMLKSFLVHIFEENIDSYEQALFKACRENDALKQRYLDLTVSALQTKKASYQIKTRIAQLIRLSTEENYTTRNMSKQKSILHKNLNDMLITFLNYHQLLKELQPKKTQTKISMNKIRKISKEITNEIQELKKQIVNSKRKYNNILNEKQITVRKVIQEIPRYLSEKKVIEIFKKKLTNVSITQVREIILSTYMLPQIEENTTAANATNALQESIKSAEALKLAFSLTNIFTVPFYYDEQILFNIYQQEHPLKDKYLMQSISALEATRACLKTKSRIAQLIHLTQKENYCIRAVRMIETYLCRDLDDLLENSSTYYRLIEEMKSLGSEVRDKISARKMKKINIALLEQVRTLQNRTSSSQRYYEDVLKTKKVTENQVIQNILSYLTKEKIIAVFQKQFTHLSSEKIRELIISTKIIPQIRQIPNIIELTQERTESEERSMLESVIVNISKNPFYYNEQTLFDAYINNFEFKKDILALTISGMQAERACLKIRTRIIQLVNMTQKENSRASDVSTEKNFLYRDLAEFFTSSSNYNRLINKLQLPRIHTHKQTQNSSSKKLRAYLTRTQMMVMAANNKDDAELFRRSKNQLRITQRHYDFTIKDRQATEKQIIENMLFYLTEQKAINTFKKKFTSLTEDGIKETITRSILLILENQAIEATNANSSQANQEQNDLRSKHLAPSAKKSCIRKSQVSASLSKAPAKSETTQSTSQVSILRFSCSQSETLVTKEPSQSSRIQFSSQKDSEVLQIKSAAYENE